MTTATALSLPAQPSIARAFATASLGFLASFLGLFGLMLVLSL